MNKTYKQPMTDIVSVELTHLMVGSLVEDGGILNDFPSLGVDDIDGNLSR